MGKTTLHRLSKVSARSYCAGSLPICGGTLFLFGSLLFWPGASRSMEAGGALCFLVGSLCYLGAPLLDFWDLSFDQANLAEPPPRKLARVEDLNRSERYEYLYKAQMIRTQRANTCIYACGGVFFVAGSTLFFPAMEELIMHGGWLYISGCMLTLLGAVLAFLTAFEMRRTAAAYAYPPIWLYLPRTSDETAAMISCVLYICGNLVFIVGSILFFPRVLEAGGPIVRISAVLLFILGSILFLAGAVVDLIVILRGAHKRPLMAGTPGLKPVAMMVRAWSDPLMSIKPPSHSSERSGREGRTPKEPQLMRINTDGAALRHAPPDVEAQPHAHDHADPFTHTHTHTHAHTHPHTHSHPHPHRCDHPQTNTVAPLLETHAPPRAHTRLLRAFNAVSPLTSVAGSVQVIRVAACTPTTHQRPRTDAQTREIRPQPIASTANVALSTTTTGRQRAHVSRGAHPVPSACSKRKLAIGEEYVPMCDDDGASSEIQLEPSPTSPACKVDELPLAEMRAKVSEVSDQRGMELQPTPSIRPNETMPPSQSAA